MTRDYFLKWGWPAGRFCLIPGGTVAGQGLNLNKLNPNQRRAVLHGEGPLLILAGAGSGKTSTMTHRIAHLVAERRVPAENILGLSFTNKAAQELKGRVRTLITSVAGGRACRGLTVTTFHSLCVRMLRRHADRVGFQRDFTIVDDQDQMDILRQILKRIRIDDRRFEIRSILFQISRAKNSFLSPDEAEAHFLEGGGFGGGSKIPTDYALATASSYSKYLEALRALNAMDFDDLLFYTVKLLSEHEDVRREYGYTFRHILVDEYQDTNPAQFKILSLLTEAHKNICVVGDDDQSIYAWRGADPTHILEFDRHYPGATVITLDQNYRSTSTILDAANRVIARNRVRHPKSLWSDRGEGEPLTLIIAEDDREEGEIVAEEILRQATESREGTRRQVRPWSDFAILYRSNTQSRIFEENLRMKRIPYRMVGGMSFLDRKEIKDLLCYWRLIVNPSDDASLRRIINWPSRGIGKGTLEKLGQHAFSRGISLFEATADAAEVAPRAFEPLHRFREAIESARVALAACPIEGEALAEWGRGFLETFEFRRGLDEDYSDNPAQATARMDNLEELIHALGQVNLEELREEIADNRTAGDSSGGDDLNGIAILREYLARLMLDAQEEEDEAAEASKDEVTLLTLHGAKGLEYPIVFLVGMEEGLLPHKRVLEEATDLSEERRLCYVGITRARDRLFLTRAKNRIRWGKTMPRNPSRFLEEIPDDLILVRDETAEPDLSSKEAVAKHEERVSSFLDQIRARLK